MQLLNACRWAFSIGLLILSTVLLMLSMGLLMSCMGLLMLSTWVYSWVAYGVARAKYTLCTGLLMLSTSCSC